MKPEKIKFITERGVGSSCHEELWRIEESKKGDSAWLPLQKRREKPTHARPSYAFHPIFPKDTSLHSGTAKWFFSLMRIASNFVPPFKFWSSKGAWILFSIFHLSYSSETTKFAGSEISVIIFQFSGACHITRNISPPWVKGMVGNSFAEWPFPMTLCEGTRTQPVFRNLDLHSPSSYKP